MPVSGKTLAFLVLGPVGLTLVGVFAYRLVSPEIVVANESAAVVMEVVVQLPSNRVVFGSVSPGMQSAIYYSSDQADGTYDYTFTFNGAPDETGSCGYVTAGEYGKRVTLLVTAATSIECHETNKIF